MSRITWKDWGHPQYPGLDANKQRLPVCRECQHLSQGYYWDNFNWICHSCSRKLGGYCLSEKPPPGMTFVTAHFEFGSLGIRMNRYLRQHEVLNVKT